MIRDGSKELTCIVTGEFRENREEEQLEDERINDA